MSRLKSTSSSKSEREMVNNVQLVLAIASVERSERSNTDISPKQAPFFRIARASSPDPGMVREMRTSPSEIMKSRLPGSPSLKTCWPTANFCSRHTSDTRASSPSSRSWKIAACLSKLRFTGRRYGAPEGGASETVGDAGGSPDRASASSGRRVSVRAPAGVAARLGDRGGRAVRHLGLRPGGRPGARNANAGEGDVMRQVWLAMLLVAGGITPLTAQEFHPPPVRPSGGRGTHIGLFGFGVRGGIELAGSTQMVFGVTLDAGNLVSPRLRIRPSGEIGFFNGRNSYVGSLEALYRFTGDEQTATPYVGAGFSLVGHQACGADPDCPDLWANVVVGFELHYRSTFNWLLEYHGMGGFRHNRLYVGLTTRRGN